MVFLSDPDVLISFLHNFNYFDYFWLNSQSVCEIFEGDLKQYADGQRTVNSQVDSLTNDQTGMKDIQICTRTETRTDTLTDTHSDTQTGGQSKQRTDTQTASQTGARTVDTGTRTTDTPSTRTTDTLSFDLVTGTPPYFPSTNGALPMDPGRGQCAFECRSKFPRI